MRLPAFWKSGTVLCLFLIGSDYVVASSLSTAQALWSDHFDDGNHPSHYEIIDYDELIDIWVTNDNDRRPAVEPSSRMTGAHIEQQTAAHWIQRFGAGYLASLEE